MAGGVGCVVEVALGVGLVEVDGGGYDSVLECEGADDELDGAGGAEHVAVHGLGAADDGAACLFLAEGFLDGGRLALVVEWCAGAVGVDVEVLAGLEGGLFECEAHGFGGAASLGVGGGVVVGVAGVAVAAYLGVDFGAALAGELFAFKYQYAGAFAEHEAAAAAVKRQRGGHGVGGGGEGLHVGEAADGHVADGGFGAAGDDGVGASLADEAVGFADGVGAGGAGGDDGQVGALGVVGDGHVAAGDVGDHLGDEEGRDAADAAIDEVGVLAFEGLYAAHAAADGGAEAAGVDVVADAQAAVVHGLAGGGEGVEGEEVVVAHHGFVDAVVLGAEVLHFGRDFDREVGGVDVGDGADAAHAVEEVVPEGLDVVA